MLISFPDTPFALAVSGGSDSMAMLLLAAKTVPTRTFTVLTVDHGLRAESQAEADQVKRWCAARNIAHVTLPIVSPKPKSGIQAWARKARYDAMTQWCRQNDVEILLTAHTQNDQAETVAMRSTRTRSDRSLAGIWPENDWQGIRILRPLLNERRDDLKRLLSKEQVPWIDDPSNTNPMFERVRVRHSLPDHDVSRLAEVALTAQKHVAEINHLVEAFVKAHVKIDDLFLIDWNRAEFSALDKSVQTAVLTWAIRAVGGAAGLESGSVTAIIEDLPRLTATRRTLGGAMIAVRNHHILVGREPARIPKQPLEIPESGVILWDNRFIVRASPGSLVSPAGHRCPRPGKRVPAFILAGLPRVELRDGTTVFPHFSPHSAITVHRNEQFRS